MKRPPLLLDSVLVAAMLMAYVPGLADDALHLAAPAALTLTAPAAPANDDCESNAERL